MIYVSSNLPGIAPTAHRSWPTAIRRAAKLRSRGAESIVAKVCPASLVQTHPGDPCWVWLSTDLFGDSTRLIVRQIDRCSSNLAPLIESEMRKAGFGRVVGGLKPDSEFRSLVICGKIRDTYPNLPAAPRR